jgi:putative membrane protein
MTALARFTAFCGRSESDDVYFMICSDDYMLNEDHVISGLGVGLFLLLAFRANNSYERFWEGRRAWGRIKEVCRDLTRQICFEVHIGSIQNRVSNTNTNVNVDVDDTSSDEYVQDCYERRRAIAFVAAFAATLKLNMRGELNTVPELGGLLCFQDILNIEKSRVMPQFCVDVLTYYLQKQVRAGKLTVQEYCTMNETCLGVLADSMGTCERIRKTPIPLSYVLQLRVFLILWLCLYPLHLIGHYGWFTPLLATLVDFAVLGIESMACEIENPFGYHKNCIDLCSFCKGIVANVLEILSRVEHPDRDKVFNYQKVQERNTQLFSDGLTGPPLQDYKVITKDSLDFISEMEKKAI